MLDYIWLVLLFPLVGVIINAFVGPRLGKRGAGIVASVMVGLSFVVAAGSLIELIGRGESQRLVFPLGYQWLTVGKLSAAANLLVDPLSAIMITVVTGVSFLIHVYSIGYMANDERYSRYFTYLNLFVLAMLILVLADNLILMYVGWEGVGLCSFLLIGFWFERKTAADAGKKAFLVNRFGDIGFALGIMLVFATFGSVSFLDVVGTAPAETLTAGIATTISLLLLLGAVAKSAQIPLYVWLPDAMEGPTPVSALIHAATMVTAGVYMVARMHLLFQFSGKALTVVAAIGAITALYSATMALVQTDIKRVLAYSTISQLGYMFLGAGVGAYASGIFHLATHAFFKALLFLGAGSVMHALSGELDLRKMGGLRSKMPVTFWLFLIGGLAIAGFPGLAGFFSKDEILFRAFVADQKVLWAIALITAGLTAFYIFRVIFLAFFGESRVDKKVAHHVHESPRVMTVPMGLLALLSIVGGYVGIPKVLGGNNWIEKFLEGSLGWTIPQAASPNYGGEGSAPALMIVSVVVALVGIGVAYYMYVLRPGSAKTVVEQAGWLHTLVSRKYYIDEIYAAIIVKPLRAMGDWFADVLDPRGIDGVVNGVGALVALGGRGLQALQTGLVRTYAWVLLAGVVLLLVFVIAR